MSVFILLVHISSQFNEFSEKLSVLVASVMQRRNDKVKDILSFLVNRFVVESWNGLARTEEETHARRAALQARHQPLLVLSDGEHQGGRSILVLGVRIGAGGDQLVENQQVIVLHGVDDGSISFFVFRVEVNFVFGLQEDLEEVSKILEIRVREAQRELIRFSRCAIRSTCFRCPDASPSGKQHCFLRQIQAGSWW